VKHYVGERKPLHPLLDVAHPVTYGPLDLQDYYFEHKKQQAEAMVRAKEIVRAVGKEYGALTGREYGFFDAYRTGDADEIVVCLGSAAGTMKAVADALRGEGRKVGVLKLRMFRPFPADEIAEAIGRAKRIVVLDRAEGFNAVGGPLGAEVKAALYGRSSAKVVNCIYGLGGRDLSPELARAAFDLSGPGTVHLGVRE